MIITYKAEDAEPREWHYRPGKLLSPEAEAIEKRTGWTYAEFGQYLMRGSMLAKRAILWVLLKRENPPLRFDQVEITAEMVEVDFDADERAAALEAVNEDEDMDPALRAQVLRMLRKGAPPADDEEEDGPKDRPDSPS